MPTDIPIQKGEASINFCGEEALKQGSEANFIAANMGLPQMQGMTEYQKMETLAQAWDIINKVMDGQPKEATQTVLPTHEPIPSNASTETIAEHKDVAPTHSEGEE